VDANVGVRVDVRVGVNVRDPNGQYRPELKE